MIYEYREKNLPLERPVLCVAWTGNKYLEAKDWLKQFLNSLAFHFLKRLENMGSFTKLLISQLPSSIYIWIFS